MKSNRNDRSCNCITNNEQAFIIQYTVNSNLHENFAKFLQVTTIMDMMKKTRIRKFMCEILVQSLDTSSAVQLKSDPGNIDLTDIGNSVMENFLSDIGVYVSSLS